MRVTQGWTGIHPETGESLKFSVTLEDQDLAQALDRGSWKEVPLSSKFELLVVEAERLLLDRMSEANLLSSEEVCRRARDIDARLERALTKLRQLREADVLTDDSDLFVGKDQEH